MVGCLVEYLCALHEVCVYIRACVRACVRVGVGAYVCLWVGGCECRCGRTRLVL